MSTAPSCNGDVVSYSGHGKVYEVWGPPDHSAYDSDHRGPSVNTDYDPEHRSTSDQSAQYTLENYGDPQVGRAAPDTHSMRRRTIQPTYSNTRGGPGSMNSDHLLNPMSDYSSMLEDFADLTKKDRLEQLSRLSASALASLHSSISCAVPSQTTVVIPEHGRSRFYGVEKKTEVAIAKLVGEELEYRKWWIQTRPNHAIFADLSYPQIVLEDGDMIHHQYRWLIIPSPFKLKAYEHGLHGLSEEHREEEIKLFCQVAVDSLTPPHKRYHSSCGCGEAWPEGSTDGACLVSQIEMACHIVRDS